MEIRLPPHADWDEVIRDRRARADKVALVNDLVLDAVEKFLTGKAKLVIDITGMGERTVRYVEE